MPGPCYLAAALRGHLHEAVRLAVRSGPPIVVYGAVKTGSSAVARSLGTAGVRPVHHVHFLTRASLAGWRRRYRESFPRIGRIPHAYFQSAILARALARRGPAGARAWKVVCGTRDPVAQAASWFFYEAEVFDLPRRRLFAGATGAERDANADTLAAGFLDALGSAVRAPESHLFGWFDAELARALGLDVVAAGFPRDRGHALYRGEGRRPEVLVYKLEALADPATAAAVAASCATPGLDIRSHNRARDLPYAAVYERFRARLQLPAELLDAVYGQPYVRAIYAGPEREAMRAKWDRGAGSGAV